MVKSINPGSQSIFSSNKNYNLRVKKTLLSCEYKQTSTWTFYLFFIRNKISLINQKSTNWEGTSTWTLTHLVFRPTPDRTNWVRRGTNCSKDWSSTTSMHKSSVSHIGEPLAIEIRKFSSFSVWIPTFAACNWEKIKLEKWRCNHYQHENGNKIMYIDSGSHNMCHTST